jgi:hypothetical protein
MSKEMTKDVMAGNCSRGAKISANTKNEVNPD